MKDILKFTLSAFLMLATLTLVSVVFIQAFMSDYDWINLLLTVLYSLLVVAAALYEGAQRGAKDCKYRNLMQHQMEERGYVMNAEEASRCYLPYKGFVAGLIASSPSILLAFAAIIAGKSAPVWLNIAARISLSAYLSLFQYVEALLPMLFLPLALVYPLCIGLGYLAGPRLWKRQVEQMEKAKREKRRKVNRKKKRAKTAA